MVVKNAKKTVLQNTFRFPGKHTFLMKNTYFFVKTYLRLSFAARVFFLPKVPKLVKEK